MGDGVSKRRNVLLISPGDSLKDIELSKKPSIVSGSASIIQSLPHPVIARILSSPASLSPSMPFYTRINVYKCPS